MTPPLVDSGVLGSSFAADGGHDLLAVEANAFPGAANAKADAGNRTLGGEHIDVARAHRQFVGDLLGGNERSFRRRIFVLHGRKIAPFSVSSQCDPCIR